MAIFFVLVVITILTLTPFIWAIMNSFKNNNEILGSVRLFPNDWLLVNYKKAWVEGGFNKFFLNSFIITIGTTFIKLLIVAPSGYAFAKLKIKDYPFVFYFVLMGMAVPIESVVVALFYQLKSYNMLDSLWGVTLPLIGLGVPFGIFLMRNFFREVPDSIVESAAIDGANLLTIFTKIMLPLAKPGLMVVAILTFLEAWNEYMLSILVLVSDSSKTIPLGIVKFFGTKYYDSDYGAVFASVVISFIPSILVYILLQRTFIQGITGGAVKE